MDFALGTIIDIATSTAILLLTALGLYIIYGLLKVINLAHGDMMMLGAYSTSVFLQMGVNFWGAACLAALLLVALGVVIDRLVIRYLYNADNLSTLLATWGLSLSMIETVRLIFGPSGRFVDAPTSQVLDIFGVPYPLYRFILVIITIILMIAVWFILKKTNAGIIIRATMENPSSAEATGINTKQVYRWGFATGSGLAGLAGALLAPISAVTPYMGIDYSVNSFLVIITGGLGSLLAPVAGSVVVGGFRSLLDSFLGVTTATMGMLILVVVVILVRPQGIANR